MHEHVMHVETEDDSGTTHNEFIVTIALIISSPYHSKAPLLLFKKQGKLASIIQFRKCVSN